MVEIDLTDLPPELVRELSDALRPRAVTARAKAKYQAQRIREIACLCASRAIVCRQEGENPTPLLWSMTVFFEEYIRNGSAGTLADFGPKEPVELKPVETI